MRISGSWTGLRHLLIGMMEPAQDRRGDDRPAAPRHAVCRRHAVGDLLVDALMRPRAIEVGDVRPQRPA